MTYKKLDSLEQLLGCYFHQDWTDEFGNVASALHAIIRSEPKERLLDCVEEIDALLAASLSENDLMAILTDQFGCYFDPNSDGLTCEQWLKRIQEKFVQLN